MSVHEMLAEWSSWGWPLIANHLWQATLLAIIAFGAAGLLRSAPARARYAAWLIVAAKFALPSALFAAAAARFGIELPSLVSSSAEYGERSAVVLQLASPIAALDPASEIVAGSVRTHSEVFCALAIVWFTGFAVLFLAWWWRRWRFRSAVKCALQSPATRESVALERVRTWLGIKRSVGLRILPRTVEPGVWGVWRPIVLLPESMADELSEAELEAVMMHEMVHVARFDNLVANLHRFLCCLLWFHPIVWGLDHLLLVERERVCDETVIALSGSSEAYASSLMKVLRFCLGWNVAGASNATGSDLGRRVERIMSSNIHSRFSALHRAVVAAVATLVVLVSIATGLFANRGAAAQERKPREGVPGGVSAGVPGGVSGGVPGGVSGGVAGGIAGGVTGDPSFIFIDTQDKLFERLDQATETAVEFKNSAKSPLVISAARVRAVLRDQNQPGDEMAAVPIVTVTNNTDRRIKAFVLEFRNLVDRRPFFERTLSPIEPRAAYTTGQQRRFVTVAGNPTTWSVKVVGVLFEDGEVWGSVPPPPPPPPPPTSGLDQKFEQAPEISARVVSGVGDPVSIKSASLKAVEIEPPAAGSADPNAKGHYIAKLAVDLINNTPRRVIGVSMFCSNQGSMSGTYAMVTIEPNASYRFETPREGFFALRGDPARIDVRIVGVKFEDGDTWGSFPALPPRPPRAPATDSPGTVRKSGGVMMTSAINRVNPEYPALAKAAQVSGAVAVDITVDEAGYVIAAQAVSGHPLLKDAAVSAARQWQFSPTLIDGRPVKVMGTLTFNFQP